MTARRALSTPGRLRQDAQGPEGPTVLHAIVQACPEHAPALREGWGGWLPDDPALEP